MSEIELQRALQEQIAKTPVGEKMTLNFTGIPTNIDVEMSFAGGWRITQTIIPGRAFEFFRGEDGFLEGITITIQPYEGLQ